MEKIKFHIKDKVVSIIATDRICGGLYIVDGADTVERNNQLLGIQFDALPESTEPQHMVSKIGAYSFLTTRSTYGYFQHILLPTIETEAFNDYVDSLSDHPELQEKLRTVFQLKDSSD